MSKVVESNFAQRVNSLVAQIPEGRVMTYGQIAAICGNARAARIVGGIAHFGDPNLPWQRVVNRTGGLASGYPGGRGAHKKHLEAEGLKINEEFRVIGLADKIWQPEKSNDQQSFGL
jgi:methylated-DNA-protein-cysteine methyltransferase related protein